MRWALALAFLAASVAQARADITRIAAATTIAVNVLEIRSTTAKAIKVWKAARKAAAKAAKKVKGQ